MRRTPLPALTVLLALGLSVVGCGDQEKKSSLGPVSDEKPTSAAKPSQTESADVDTRPFDDQGNEAIRGTVEASTPDEEAVAEAWFAYWDARSSSFHQAKVDPALGSVAVGEAASDVVRYVTHLRSKKLRTVGDTKFGVSDIELEGNSAILVSCAENKSIDLDAAGKPAEVLTPFYNFNGTLVKSGGSWRVISVQTVGENACKA